MGKQLKKRRDSEKATIPHPVPGRPPVPLEEFMVDTSDDSSYLNAYSNVVLLHDMYRTVDYNPDRLGRQQVVLREYVQGIGTRVVLDDAGIPITYEGDYLIGQSAGRAATGVIARAREGLTRVVSRIVQLLTDHEVGLRSLTFDVFGFSRGATAARFCVNDLLKKGYPDTAHPPHGTLGRLFAEAQLEMPALVDVRFVGLFDTVVSDATEKVGGGFLLEPINTSLEKLTGKAMHIIARNEHRLRFPLTISDAPDNYDLYLYGVHSDIGGSYAEDDFAAVVQYGDVSSRTHKQGLAKLDAEAEAFRKQFTVTFNGTQWVTRQPSAPTSVQAAKPPARREIRLEKASSYTTQSPDFPARLPETIEHYFIVDRGPISNKMALVAFNAMRQYAVLQGVPLLLDHNKAKIPYPGYYELPPIPYLKTYYAAVEKTVKTTKANVVVLPKAVLYPLFEHYVHESANYNRAIVTHARGKGTNLYANEPGLEDLKRPAEAADATADLKREYLLPEGRTTDNIPGERIVSLILTSPTTNQPLTGVCELTIRTFLPYDYVQEPLANFFDEANVRTYPQYLDANHGGHLTQQRFLLDFAARTGYYLSEAPPPTYRKKTNGPNADGLGKITRYDGASLGDEDSTVVSKYPGQKQSYDTSQEAFVVKARISAKNPAFPLFTPAIDYDFTLLVNNYGEFHLTGRWDGFPALEIFVKDVATGQVRLLYFEQPTDAGQTHEPAQLYNLIDGHGDKFLNLRGKLTDLSVQHDRVLPPAQIKSVRQLFGHF